jgi:hypothetical protein
MRRIFLGGMLALACRTQPLDQRDLGPSGIATQTDLAVAGGDYLAIGHPNPLSPPFVFIDLLHKEQVAEERCIRVLLESLSASPPTFQVQLPPDWAIRVIEVYGPDWDCSPRFQFGIPSDLSETAVGAVTFEGGNTLPCFVSAHLDSSLAGGRLRFDVDHLPVRDGCF